MCPHNAYRKLSALCVTRLEDRTVPTQRVWTGDVNANWGANVAGNTNWAGDVLPVNGDDLLFPVIAANHTNTNDMTNLVVNTLTVGGNDYVIGGNAVTLTSYLDSSAAGANVMNLPLNLPGTLTATVNAANTTSTLGGVLSGAGGLLKAGPGMLRLSGATSNTYAGTTTVTAGTLELSKNGGASTALAVGGLSVNAGTARELFSNQIGDTSSVTVNSPGALDVNGHFDTFGALTVNGGSVTVGTGVVSFASVNMTGGSITAADAGQVQFRGDGTFTSDAVGGASISGGHVQLQGVTRTLTVNDGPAATDLDLASGVQGTAAEGLTKAGAGLLLLSGSTSNTYTGPTTVNAGTLELNKLGPGTQATGALIVNLATARLRANDEIGDTSAVIVNAGGTFDLNGNLETVGPLTVNGGTVKTSGTGVGRLTAASAAFGSTSTLAMKLVSGTGSDRLTVSGPLTVGGNVQLSLGQAVAGGTAITLLDNTGAGPIGGTFANLAPGSVQTVGGQAFTVSYAGGTGNDLVLSRVLPPTVTGTQINGGTVQRSMVTSLTVTFSKDVALPVNAAAAFTLQRIGGGTVTIGTALAVVVLGTTQVTLSGFSGAEASSGGSLNDGRYMLTALAAAVSANGVSLDGNGDGIAGDDFVFADAGQVGGLFRLFGDFNGDRTVNGLDLNSFRNAFGTVSTDSGYVAFLDFDGDGAINGIELTEFRKRFGVILP